VAEDGPANTLVIKSLIDGTFTNTDLAMTVSGVDLTTLPASEQTSVLAAYKAFAANSAAVIADAQVAQAAAVVAKNAVSGMDVAPVLGTGTGSGLSFAVVTTQGVAAVTETATFTPADLVAGETLVINGLTITAGVDGALAADVLIALTTGVTAGGAGVGGANNAAAFTVAAAGATAVYTSAVAGNVADLANTGSAALAPVIVQGVAAVTETAVTTINGAGANGETITFDGVTHNVAGLTGAQVAALIDGAADGLGWTDAAAGNVVTFSSIAAGNVADVVAASFVSNLAAPAVLNGTVSTAQSDNTITLGAGDDVVVLGTGALSNDTLVYAGYNLGKDTIVNFSEVGGNADKLNFTSYLNGKASASGSVESQVRIATTLNGDANTEANSVTVLNGAFNTTTFKFADLSAAKLLAAVNSTNTGAADFAGINAGTLNATTGYTASGVGTTLVGGVGKAVVMVQNNLNEGEYAVYELTFNGVTASNATADFSAAELIGVLDFGNTLAPALPLFA